MSFYDAFSGESWENIRQQIYNTTAENVERTLAKTERLNHTDFLHLVSPIAQKYLEPMAQKSMKLTRERFGNTMQMFAPMYLSNECQNICTYCGFSLDNKLPRRTLSTKEIEQEIAAIKAFGFDHILLVTGEANQTVGLDYFKKVLPYFTAAFSQVSIEVQPMDYEDYLELKQLGLYSVLVYQETYHENEYKKHHPKGKKSNFRYRLETPDRLGEAGIHKIGIGALYGLEDWRIDSAYVAEHLSYLEKQYWQSKFSISFPRLRPHEGDLEPKVEMTDKDLVQLICAYRLYNADVELSMSTREAPKFRDHVAKLGITTMSAGSKTNPGGYSVEPQSLEQFEIEDMRTPAEISEMLSKQGFDVVWKDWETQWML